MKLCRCAFLALVSVLVFQASAQSAQVIVRVTAENLAPENSISFAPLRVGFNNGSFDAFNTGESATPAIISIAEGGSGSDWFPAFAAADPTATLGSVLGPGGPFLPGQSASAEFLVDTSINQFFTFAAMVVPSNDLFIGNDNPQGIHLFDSNGNLLISEINQTGASIWDANSEQAIAANAAFLVGSVNSQREAENGLVAFDFSELSTYQGLQTVAGYTFDATPINSDTDIFRIRFQVVQVVPEPSSMILMSLAGFGILGRVWIGRRASAG